MSGIKGMKRSKEHNIKISIALKGKRKSKIHCDRISKKAKIRLSIPENNPNFRGDNVGYVGIHIWIVKKFGLADICEKCGKIGTYKNNKWTISYALIKGKNYERKRDNFKKLCNRCHRNYDKTKKWNKNISIGKTKNLIK